MITKKTVLVLGAGASAPYGYPTGEKLIDDLVRDFNKGNSRVLALLKDLGAHKGAGEFINALETAAPKSVDRFLEVNARFQEVGRLAMAAQLLAYEKPHLLEPRPSEDKGETEDDVDDWVRYLWQHIDDREPQENLKIVTFNYDRSLEDTLFRRYKALHDFTVEQAAERVAALGIDHVHGQLDRLRFQGDEGRAYGDETDIASTVARCADQIRIISDDTGGSAFESARRAIAEAEHVCFLGCGYHEQNMERLGIPVSNDPRPILWGSGYQLHGGEIAIARRAVGPREVRMPNVDVVFEAKNRSTLRRLGLLSSITI